MKIKNLNIGLLEDEFKSLLNDDEDFRFQWSVNGKFTEENFYEWFQDVIFNSSLEDLKKYCE